MPDAGGLIKDAGNGADIITHDKGSALIVYNTGVDTVTITASRAGVYVAVNVAGVRSVDASTSDAAVTLDGRGAGENITTYTGGSGDDSIFGAALGDLLTGNDGNDTITGGLSADIINVGNGSNTVVFTNGLTADVILVIPLMTSALSTFRSSKWMMQLKKTRHLTL